MGMQSNNRERRIDKRGLKPDMALGVGVERKLVGGNGVAVAARTDGGNSRA